MGLPLRRLRGIHQGWTARVEKPSGDDRRRRVGTDPRFVRNVSPQLAIEQREALAVLRRAIDDDLTDLQRRVFVAIALNQSPWTPLRENSAPTETPSTRPCSTRGVNFARVSPLPDIHDPKCLRPVEHRSRHLCRSRRIGRRRRLRGRVRGPASLCRIGSRRRRPSTRVPRTGDASPPMPGMPQRLRGPARRREAVRRRRPVLIPVTTTKGFGHVGTHPGSVLSGRTHRPSGRSHP